MKKVVKRVLWALVVIPITLQVSFGVALEISMRIEHKLKEAAK